MLEFFFDYDTATMPLTMLLFLFLRVYASDFCSSVPEDGRYG
jgi:hypothetical protein